MRRAILDLRVSVGAAFRCIGWEGRDYITRLFLALKQLDGVIEPQVVRLMEVEESLRCADCRRCRGVHHIALTVSATKLQGVSRGNSIARTGGHSF